jgi:hypothetical protein
MVSQSSAPGNKTNPVKHLYLRELKSLLLAALLQYPYNQLCTQTPPPHIPPSTPHLLLYMIVKYWLRHDCMGSPGVIQGRLRFDPILAILSSSSIPTWVSSFVNVRSNALKNIFFNNKWRIFYSIFTHVKFYHVMVEEK